MTTTPKSANTSLKSPRLQAQLHLCEAEEAIETQSEFHLLVRKELTTDISSFRIEELHSQLANSENLNQAIEHFEIAREIGVSEEKITKMVKQLDRLEADKANITRQVEQRLSAMTNGSKDTLSKQVGRTEGSSSMASRSPALLSNHSQMELIQGSSAAQCINSPSQVIGSKQSQRSHRSDSSSRQSRSNHVILPHSDMIPERTDRMSVRSNDLKSSSSTIISTAQKSHKSQSSKASSKSQSISSQVIHKNAHQNLETESRPRSTISDQSYKTVNSLQSGRSHTSSYYKTQATKAAAKVAAAEARLEAELKAKQAEEELEILQRKQQEEVLAKKRHIAEIKLRGDVEAGKAQQRAFEDALEQQQDEDLRSSMLRPPTRSHQQVGSTNERMKPSILVDNPVAAKADIESPLTTDQLLQSQMSSNPAALAQNISDVIAKTVGESMATAITMNRNHIPAPAVFNGEPLEYTDWRIAFNGLIDSCPYTPLQKLHLLRQYVSGDAKECIKGYFTLKKPNAYQVALNALEEEFGSHEIIEETFMEKLEHWQNITDHAALKKYSYFLNQCATAMESIPGLQSLNSKRENKKLIRILPETLRDRWIRYTTEQVTKLSDFPDFSKYAKFIAHEAKVASSTF